MFIGRESELHTLNEYYNSGQFAFIPIYGRRRVGKTRLIEEFVRDKKHIFFTAALDTKEATLRIFSALVRDSLFPAGGKAVYADYNEAFADIFAYAEKNKLVLVIDEYPYLAKSYPAISSIIQIQIDHHLRHTDMMLILSGSSMSFMENQVLGYQSPLYGRRAGQIKLLPEGFAVSARYAPGLKKEEQAVMYGVTGGIPMYLSLFDDKKSLDDNIRTQFFNKNSFLFEETDNLLKQELSEPAFYKSIITAIATGASQMKDISGKTGFDTATCGTYIKPLTELGIIEREVPVTDKPSSRKSIYRIKDGMFRFWYRFVYQNVSLINLGKGDMVYERIKEQIPAFMGEVFEKMCMEYMWRSYADLPFPIQNIGRWWGNNPIIKQQQEIDFIAPDAAGNKAVFGECKWRGDKINEGVIDELIKKSEMFGFEEKYYYFFSKSGFTSGAKKRINDRIVLIDFKQV